MDSQTAFVLSSIMVSVSIISVVVLYVGIKEIITQIKNYKNKKGQ